MSKKRTADASDLPLFMKSEDISETLDMPVGAVRKWLTQGVIPSKKVGKRRWVRREDFLSAFDPKKRGRRRPRGG
jgi:hypothetical protein